MAKKSPGRTSTATLYSGNTKTQPSQGTPLEITVKLPNPSLKSPASLCAAVR